ncbi:MAG: aminodeoxychorismate/anthranilate synthase component II [Alphaproteobacteria bacterium]|nr:MAG: aminodeoxychorismate/anthranilate synthase component II [Alphaproteobacteria bacterium]
MILIIDNYDSFVYNLARYVGKLGLKHDVRRNDKITIKTIEKRLPDAIIISPGPGTPENAGISVDLVKQLGHKTPILGVCLGHQAVSEAFGGKTVRAQKPVHGKSSVITHNGSTLFKDIPSPVNVGRYHSLITNIPKEGPLTITARSDTGEIMAIQHDKHPVFGVQFHPESILTEQGFNIIENFINYAQIWHAERRIHIP